MSNSVLGSTTVAPLRAPQISQRKPQRITITISWSVYQRLLAVSNEQGRSLSNTAAYWLERQSEQQA
jgi:macrodomain Ter protein organizer (MatP/YcbG family)